MTKYMRLFVLTLTLTGYEGLDENGNDTCGNGGDSCVSTNNPSGDQCIFPECSAIGDGWDGDFYDKSGNGWNGCATPTGITNNGDGTYTYSFTITNSQG